MNKRRDTIPEHFNSAEEAGEFWDGTVGFSSEITISLNFTAEHMENAEPSGKSARIETVLKLCVLCALRGG